MGVRVCKTSWLLPLPNRLGEAQISPHRPSKDPGYHSYSHCGHSLSWFPQISRGINFACDLEHRSASNTWMAKHYGLTMQEFLARWVCTEVAAKLCNIPILQWLKRTGLVRSLSEVEDSEDCFQFVKSIPRLEICYFYSQNTGFHTAFGVKESK